MRRPMTPLPWVLVLVALAGCDFKFPLTPPIQARADARMIGNWKVVFDSTAQTKKERQLTTSWIFSVGRVSDASSAARHKAPKGAMTITAISYRSPSFDPELPVVAWPTVIGDSRYLNWCTEPALIKKGTVSGNAYQIFKYEIKGDELTLFRQADKSLVAMKKRLGKEYSAADLRQEFTRLDDNKLEKHIRATRIK